MDKSEYTDPKLESYWTKRYEEGNTGWDMGRPSPPLVAYIDQLKDKNLKILVPGAGNGHEVAYLWNEGYTKVYMLDVSPLPLQAFAKKHPEFPQNQLLLGDFFDHQGQYDLILEQTFFCSFTPTDNNRKAYAKKAHGLLGPNGKLVGLWFDFPLGTDMEKRPFGGDKDGYLQYLSPYFDTRTFSSCYNSIPPRAGKELFGIFTKKQRYEAV